MKEYEKRERRFLDWYLNKQCYKCKIDEISEIGNGDSNDFIIQSGRTYVVGEIKIRECGVNDFDTAILELKKVNNLMEIYQPYHQMGETNKLLYYAVYPKDRTILVFDIMNTPTTLTIQMAPRTTGYNRGKEKKPFVNYPIGSEIIKIKY